MNQHFLKSLIFVSLALLANACSEGSVENDPVPGCTQNICRDSSTLLACNLLTGIYAEAPCQAGCDMSTNQCRALPPSGSTSTPETPKCTADLCRDDTLLMACDLDTGASTLTPCAYGCDKATNKCKTLEKCTSDVCRDEFTLLECDVQTGSLSAVFCTLGCDMTNHVCQEPEKCTASVCKNDSLLLACDLESGAVKATPCPYGCDMTANTCKEPEKCTASVCKNDSILLACDPESGAITETPCPDGCDMTANACKEIEKCTASSCKNDTILLSCNLSTGLTSEVTCKGGCDTQNNICFACSEDAHCGGGNICEDHACVKPQCKADTCDSQKKALIPCVNGRTQEAIPCDAKCGIGAGKSGADACVEADWCSAAQAVECQGREDGKTVCNTDTNRCDTLACAKADCPSGTVCAQGACIPDDMYNAEKGTTCTPSTFVDHCRDEELYSCMKATETTYKIYTGNCKGRCRAYADGQNVYSTCIEDMTRTEACGNDTVLTGSACEEWAGEGWMTTYACTISTNGEPIVYIKDMYSCGEGYGCWGNVCE